MAKLNKGSCFILAAGCLWGTAGVFVRELNALGIYSMQAVFLRAAITAVLVFIGVFVYDRKLLRIRLRDIWCFLGTGVLSVMSFYYFYFITIETASLAAAAVLLYTAPVFVMLLSLILFKERITLRKSASCALAILGCALVAGIFGKESGGISGAALITGILSGVGYALYSIFSRFALNKGYSSLTITAYTFLFAAIAMVPFVNFSAISAAFESSPAMTVLISAGLAVFVTVIPYLLYTSGLESVSSSKASILASVEPVMACVLSILVFKENPGISGAVGIIIVIAAISILNIKSESEQKHSVN